MVGFYAIRLGIIEVDEKLNISVIRNSNGFDEVETLENHLTCSYETGNPLLA